MLSKNAVAWLVFVIVGRFRLVPGWTSEPDRRAPRPTWQASYAIAAQAPLVGGPTRRSAIVLRFCRCSEMKLVAGAGETTKAHTLKAMLDLQMCKAHLYFFARIARSLELRRAL